MANLPTRTHLTSTLSTVAEFSTALGAVYDFVAQLVVGAVPEAKTIASGVITPTTTSIVVDTEGALATDDLTNILATNTGAKTIFLRIASSARAVTIKHNQTGSGKILLANGVDLVLDSSSYLIALSYDVASTTWTEQWKNFGVHTPTASAKAFSVASLGLGTAASKDTGIDPGEVPLNSDLGELAYLTIADISALTGSTGDVTASFASSKTGCVLMDGQTIGKTGSTATNRANNDTQNLYTLLWGLNSVSFPLFNAGLPQSRGDSANADWTAGYTLGLPNGKGKTLVGRDNMGGTAANIITSAGSGINGTILGATGGSETVTLTAGQLAAHFHSAGGMTTNIDGSHSHTLNALPADSGVYNGSGGNFVGQSALTNNNEIVAGTTTVSGNHAHSLTGDTASAGSNQAHQNTQPSIIVNYFIKL